MIHATCHTADNVRCIEFDATPWFSQADAPSIIDLAQRGWASTAIADSLERRRGYEGLHDLVEYAAKRLQPESLAKHCGLASLSHLFETAERCQIVTKRDPINAPVHAARIQQHEASRNR